MTLARACTNQLVKGCCQTQGATKVLSDSPGVVEWLVGLVSLDHWLPNRQAGQASNVFWWTTEVSMEQTVREAKWNNTIFFLVGMTKKSKRPKSFFNENICRQRVMLDKKHIQSNWIYLQPSFTSSHSRKP